MARTEKRTAQSAASRAGAHGASAPAIQPPAGLLRDARRDDLSSMVRLEALFPGDRLSLRQFRHHLVSPKARLRVLDEGGIAGYALLLRHAQRPAWRLYSIVVDPARRGQGLGAVLLADAEAIARVAGAPALTLEVREDNATAIALYRGRGYVETGRRPGYYDDGAAAIRLRRTLGPATGPR
jgi:[ribosomal protein S18]-alanine N-acetyltransferase